MVGLLAPLRTTRKGYDQKPTDPFVLSMNGMLPDSGQSKSGLFAVRGTSLPAEHRTFARHVQIVAIYSIVTALLVSKSAADLVSDIRSEQP